METSRLDDILSRYAAVMLDLEDPAVYSAPERMKNLQREYSRLRPIAECHARVVAARGDLESARSLLTDAEGDDRGELEREIVTLESALAADEELLDQLLTPPHPHADKNALLEVRAGVGGDEAGLFARDLVRAYLRFAERLGFEAEVVDTNEGELGQVREALVRVVGPGAYDRYRSESGVHRVQRIPSTETQGRIHTSTATVAVMPELEEAEIEIRADDLRIDVYRAGGAGGQHVNKTSSAVRITHLPTGIVVQSQAERSQGQNREQAMRVLRSRVAARAEEEASSKIRSDVRSQIGSGSRSEKIRTYNVPQDRITDHRLKESWSGIERVLDGDLFEMTDAYLAREREEKRGTANG